MRPLRDRIAETIYNLQPCTHRMFPHATNDQLMEMHRSHVQRFGYALNFSSIPIQQYNRISRDFRTCHWP